MQIFGYLLGTGVGEIVGTAAQWNGLLVLAAIGIWILREGFSENSEREFNVEKPAGLPLASLSISLDSLGSAPVAGDRADPG
jgi:putative Mn2+ efflux pump MntP